MRAALMIASAVFCTTIATPAAAQRMKPADPCCGITHIDHVTGIVTATDQNGQTFRFRPADAGQLKTLKLGQKVFAEPCCANEVRVVADVAVKGVLVQKTDLKASALSQRGMKPADPCCAITAVDMKAKTVTARETGSGRVFKFDVRDVALMRSMKVGQKVYADFGKGTVGLVPGEPCCGIKY